MASYGSLPGVKITTESGATQSVTLGSEQYLVLVGVGNNATGTASLNEPVSIDGQSDADDKFGPQSDITDAYRTALANGANPNFVKAVMAETTEETQSFTATASGTLDYAPVVAREGRISATDVGNGSELQVVFQYDDTLSTPSAADELYLNPHTGDWEAASSTDIDVTYEYADWQSALSSVKQAVREREFGVVHPLTLAPSVIGDLQAVVSAMRNEMKLVVGTQGAPPTGTRNMHPHYDPATYTDNVEDDAIFLAGPTAQADREPSDPNFGFSAAPAVAGLMAGNATTDPIYDDSLAGVGDLAQRLSRSDVRTLSESYIMPVRDRRVPRLERNQSTYAQEMNGGWTRDFFRRRIVDLTLATIHAIAEQTIGGVLRKDTPVDVDEAIREELGDLVDDGLLESGGQQVSVYRESKSTLGIDVTITPYGVTKGAESTLTVTP